MIRPLVFGLALAAGVAGSADLARAQQPPQRTADQEAADRHFKTGVTRFNEGKFGEALDEFERAYKISPHPLVLYNIAGCLRELGRYGEAVKHYKRFLGEGVGKAPARRLADAQSELQGIYAIVTRVTVRSDPATGVSLLLDGAPLGTLPLDMPLILPPGDHKLTARAEGRAEVEQPLRLVAGKEATVELKLPAIAVVPGPKPGTGTGTGTAPGTGTPPPGPTVGTRPGPDTEIRVPVPPPVQPPPRRFAVNAGFGTNARRIAEADTGTATVGVALGLGSRLELGLDMTIVAYSVIPSVRLRLAGDMISLHAIAAAPISFNDGDEMETFVAGAAGLGLRLRLSAMPSLALRLESYAAFAGKNHGTTIPAFLGGELWF